MLTSLQKYQLQRYPLHSMGNSGDAPAVTFLPRPRRGPEGQHSRQLGHHSIRHPSISLAMSSFDINLSRVSPPPHLFHYHPPTSHRPRMRWLYTQERCLHYDPFLPLSDQPALGRSRPSCERVLGREVH